MVDVVAFGLWLWFGGRYVVECMHDVVVVHRCLSVNRDKKFRGRPSVCLSRLDFRLRRIVDAELHLTHFGGKEYIYVRPPTTYDMTAYDTTACEGST